MVDAFKEDLDATRKMRYLVQNACKTVTVGEETELYCNSANPHVIPNKDALSMLSKWHAGNDIHFELLADGVMLDYHICPTDNGSFEHDEPNGVVISGTVYHATHTFGIHPADANSYAFTVVEN